jgi:hypothetical protein
MPFKGPKEGGLMMKYRQDQGLEGGKRWSRQQAEPIPANSEEDWLWGKGTNGPSREQKGGWNQEEVRVESKEGTSRTQNRAKQDREWEKGDRTVKNDGKQE